MLHKTAVKFLESRFTGVLDLFHLFQSLFVSTFQPEAKSLFGTLMDDGVVALQIADGFLIACDPMAAFFPEPFAEAAVVFVDQIVVTIFE